MMSPFVPVGDTARWRTLYRLLTKRDIGDTITYADLGAELDLDPAVPGERRTIQLAMRRAAQEFLTVDRRGLDTVQNVGYRVIEPAEHLGLARRHQRRARRSVGRARTVIEHVDWDKITDPEVRKALTLAGEALIRQDDMMRRMSIRQRDLETTLAETAVKVDRTDAASEALAARVARLEEKLGG